ncbi:MAG: hypothetical protein V3S69_00585 [Dehalococcoidales bacterium]
MTTGREPNNYRQAASSINDMRRAFGMPEIGINAKIRKCKMCDIKFPSEGFHNLHCMDCRTRRLNCN